jgi:hypothetical protein
MKNNKSLTSSPCDDMDKVPIAEQKTKDSVGKENAMNLSDHESSESDGDTDITFELKSSVQSSSLVTFITLSQCSLSFNFEDFVFIN